MIIEKLKMMEHLRYGYDFKQTFTNESNFGGK